MSPSQLLSDVYEKYGEHIEMQGCNGPHLVNQILAQMVLIERDEKNYYLKRLDHATQDRTGKSRMA